MHPWHTCSCGPKAATRIALGRLCRASVVDNVILDVLGQTLASSNALLHQQQAQA